MVGSASAQVLFEDKFNSDTSANWKINFAPAANAHQQEATFAWDYSTFGIPQAPGASDTLGLRLRANIPGSAAAPVLDRPTQVVSGLSLSPLGKNFGTNYQLTFDVWSNYFGSPNANGLFDNVNSPGGSMNVLAAVGTSGNGAQVVGILSAAAGSTIDGVAFATSTDGGITDDYRAFVKSNTAALGNTGIYAAGSSATAGEVAGNVRNDNNAFYTAKFPSMTAPVVQQDIAAAEFSYPSGTPNVMAGVSEPGTFGFAWHKVDVIKDGTTVTWKVNDDVFATVNNVTGLGGNNIAIGASDVNTTTAQFPSLAFSVITNLVVTALPSTGDPGDFNGDKVVNGNDFLQWQREGGDAGLLAEWKASFGTVYPSATAVPEPAAAALAVVGLAMVGASSRRRRAL